MVLNVQKSYNYLLPPAEQQRDEEWFHDLDHNICLSSKGYIAGQKMLRQRDRHNSAINNQYQQKLPLRVGHQEDQVAKLAADH